MRPEDWGLAGIGLAMTVGGLYWWRRNWQALNKDEALYSDRDFAKDLISAVAPGKMRTRISFMAPTCLILIGIAIFLSGLFPETK